MSHSQNCQNLNREPAAQKARLLPLRHANATKTSNYLYSTQENTNFRELFDNVLQKQPQSQITLKQPSSSGLQNETKLGPGKWFLAKTIFRPILDLTVATTVFQIFLTPDSGSAASIYPKKMVWESRAENFGKAAIPLEAKGDREKKRVLTSPVR